MKFEYKTMETEPGKSPPNLEQLNVAGAERWQLVWGFYITSEDRWRIYFKQEIDGKNTFDYLLKKTNKGVLPLSAKQCDEEGDKGFELVWGYHNPGGDCWFLFFKREINAA